MISNRMTGIRRNIALALLAAGTIYSVSPLGMSALALCLGVAIAVIVGNPIQDKTKLASQKLLAYSIVGLGAGMNLITVGQAGVQGLAVTIVSITVTLCLGVLLGKVLNTEKESSTLISVGTAICGGSAIAAVGPVINAKSHSMTVALGTVFLLNSLALLIFPTLGHHFDLSQRQFGLWSALAIHDTSSVVGASLQYGAEALQVGTTVKLARALWIVPVTIVIGLFYQKKTHPVVLLKKMWFIFGFVVVAAVVTWVPALHDAGEIIRTVAGRGLVLTLFLIGANLTVPTLKAVGVRPFLQGVMLWLVVSISTLLVVQHI